MKEFGRDLTEITLVPSHGGRFEVTLDGELLYSKLAADRHPAAGEISALIQQRRPPAAA